MIGLVIMWGAFISILIGMMAMIIFVIVQTIRYEDANPFIWILIFIVLLIVLVIGGALEKMGI